MFTLKSIFHSPTSEVSGTCSLPGHVLVSTDEGRHITVTDAKPATYSQASSSPEVLVDGGPAAIQGFLFLTGDPHKVMLVYSDSVLEYWAFSLDLYTWSRVGKLTLSENPCCQLMSVILHQHHNAIYWCEGKAEDKFSFSIFYRSLPKDATSWHKVEFGPSVGLVENCPHSLVFEAGDSLIVWPGGSGWPPGVCIRWLPSVFNMQVISRDQGVVVTEKKYAKRLDFHSLMAQAIPAWQQGQSLLHWKPVANIPSSRLMFLDESGVVLAISDKTDLQSDFVLPEKDTSSVLWCMCLHEFFLTCLKNELRIYSPVKRELLQVLPVDDEILGIWASNTTHEMAGVWLKHHIYKLQLSIGPDSSAVEVPSLLHHLGKPYQAALASVVGIYTKCMSKEDVTDHVFNPDICCVLDKNQFQSPALLIALLQQIMVSELPNDVVRQSLCEMAKTHERPSTKLNYDLADLMNNFWRLDEEKSDTLKGKKCESGEAHLHQELRWLLVTAEWLPVATRQSLLQLLMLEAGDEVLRYLLEDLGISEVEGVEEEEVGKTARLLWSAILYPTTTHDTSDTKKSESDLRLLKVISQMCFKVEPNELKSLVACAIHVLDVKSGAETFLDLSNKHLVCQQVLEGLPSPKQSRNPKAAAIATAWLLTESNGPTCELEALSCLLEYGLWVEGIQLVRILAGGDSYHEVFQMLVNTAIERQKLGQYCQGILEVAPDGIRGEDILGYLSRLYTHDTSGDATVFAHSGSNDVPLGAMRRQLSLEEDS